MTQQKILITGGKGMLGSMIETVLKSNNFDVTITDRDDVDITDERSVTKAFDEYTPNVLINCAAYTNVDAAEEDPVTCERINALGAANLARAAKANNTMFIHISTDQVFDDNSKEGHSEEEEPGENQINVYARTKRLGEIAVMKNNPESYVVRISWTFGPNGKNFVDTMIKLSESKDELTIVTDEIGVPTYTKDVANNLLEIINNKDKYKPGYYHAVSEGSCSRYEEAETVFEFAKIPMKLNEILLKDYPRKVKVANFSILKNTKLPKQQNWKDAIKEYINSRAS